MKPHQTKTHSITFADGQQLIITCPRHVRIDQHFLRDLGAEPARLRATIVGHLNDIYAAKTRREWVVKPKPPLGAIQDLDA